MFTGIITAIGEIVDVQALGTSAAHGKRLRVRTPEAYLARVQLGDSMALNGACMTVTAFDAAASWFEIEISAESLARTAGLDAPGAVNLELALRADDRLGGHWVTGHVDGLGRVAAFEPVGESWRLAVRVPRTLAAYMAVKGSVVVQGASLTINRVTDLPDACEVEINLIAHTLQCTTLGSLRVGQAVNIEVDLIARYVARILEVRATGAAESPN
ncbi:MAG: riboflavin synthase [Burkholderiaceae bacterium]|jgi:riboflavin synthase|nr:riboflavin synthase [Burkholderiaceae bacterium]